MTEKAENTIPSRELNLALAVFRALNPLSRRELDLTPTHLLAAIIIAHLDVIEPRGKT